MKTTKVRLQSKPPHQDWHNLDFADEKAAFRSLSAFPIDFRDVESITISTEMSVEEFMMWSKQYECI